MKNKFLCYIVDWLIAFILIFSISSLGIWLLSLFFNFLSIEFPFDFNHVLLHITTISAISAGYSLIFSASK